MVFALAFRVGFCRYYVQEQQGAKKKVKSVQPAKTEADGNSSGSGLGTAAPALAPLPKAHPFEYLLVLEEGHAALPVAVAEVARLVNAAGLIATPVAPEGEVCCPCPAVVPFKKCNCGWWLAAT